MTINEMLGGPSEVDKKIIALHMGFVKALMSKLIDKGILTGEEAIAVLEEGKSEWPDLVIERMWSGKMK